jgi:hypothetical protein
MPRRADSSIELRLAESPLPPSGGISNDNCVLYFTARSANAGYDIYYAKRGS